MEYDIREINRTVTDIDSELVKIRAKIETIEARTERMLESFQTSTEVQKIAAAGIKDTEMVNWLILLVLVAHSGIMIARHFGWIG